MILEDQFMFIQYQSCDINQNIILEERYSFMYLSDPQKIKAITLSIVKKISLATKLIHKGSNIVNIFHKQFNSNNFQWECCISIENFRDHYIIKTHI